MSKFFGFYNEKEHCYTTINTDKIIVVNEKTSTLNEKTITQAQVLVEVGEVVKEYILEEDQYQRLNLMLKNR